MKKTTIMKCEAKAWSHAGKSRRYVLFAAKEASKREELRIKEDVFDGILLHLSHRNSDKALSAQKRILRRIVEKRQAQVAFRKVGRSDDLLTASVTRRCQSKCMSGLERHRHCA